MESASLVRWKCVKVLSGTALLGCVVVVVLGELVPAPFELPGDNAFGRAFKVPAEGVYSTEVVVAFEPAEEDPEAEKEEEAPGPEVPEEAFAWIYKCCSVFGSCWNCGWASRITWYWLSCVYMVLI